MHIRFAYQADDSGTPVVIDDRWASKSPATAFLADFERSHNPRLAAYLVDDDPTADADQTKLRLNCEELWDS
ncbi:hypothetical protein ACFYV7_15060 [Nocardia suismassiliense]|uniref:Uncharacterized protein n=1 Tax=Nocardia suismassiliense TaxID=2077092 RepID=A0ABW6QS97_9NOCA